MITLVELNKSIVEFERVLKNLKCDKDNIMYIYYEDVIRKLKAIKDDSTKDKNMKVFELGQVLSVSTGFLFCDMCDLRNILNFMTNEDLNDTGVLYASKICKIEIENQLPFLKHLNPNEFSEEEANEYLHDMILVMGTR